MPNLIEAINLVKTYPGVRAVDGISFAVETGCCYGLLGPNGAGKTTTMEMIEGITEPDSGQILFQGRAADDGFAEKIGIQFQTTSLHDFQSVRETLEMFASMYQQSADIDELIALCQLEEYTERDTRKLSGGQRQRVLLAVALVNDPLLVFLDEPTTGLDPQSRRNFWTLIENIKRAGKTVILTTHYMEEAYRLCERIAIVDHGQIIIEGEPDELLREHFHGSVIRLPEHALPDGYAEPASVRLVDHEYELFTDDVQGSLAELESAGFRLDACRIIAPTLEDLFLKLTGHSLRN